MLFELYHKNIQVLTVEYDLVTNKFGKIISINNDKHIPVGIQNIENYEMQRSLQFWWDSRLIPYNDPQFLEGRQPVWENILPVFLQKKE